MHRLRTYYAAAPCTCVLYLNEYFLQWYRTHLNTNPSMNGNLPYTMGTLPALQVPTALLPGMSLQQGPTGPPGLPSSGPPGLPRDGLPGPPTPPGPPDPTGLPIPMPLRPVPVRPVMYQPRFPVPPPTYNVPVMQSILPQGIQAEMFQNASTQDNAHTETGQPSNYAPHVQSQPVMPTGLLLPDRHYYPRNMLPPEDQYKKYMAVYQAGYQESMPAMFDSGHYSIDGLPAEARHDCRMNQNYALMNGDRHIEQTWTAVSEAFFDGPTKVRQPFQSDAENRFALASAEKRLNGAPCSRADDKELEEELEALVRRIDTEFKNAD